MRLVIIEKCSYERFSWLRDNLISNNQSMYGLISAEYAKDVKIARFWFWDADYIPEKIGTFPFSAFIQRPPQLEDGFSIVAGEDAPP